MATYFISRFKCNKRGLSSVQLIPQTYPERGTARAVTSTIYAPVSAAQMTTSSRGVTTMTAKALAGPVCSKISIDSRWRLLIVDRN